MRERVLAMREIWTHDEAEYHGRFVDFGPIWSCPKPIQRPHPPVLVGGDGATTFDRVIEYGDGWVPIVRPGPRPFPDRVAELRRRCEEAGREPVPVTAFWGSRPEERELEEHVRLGVDRAVVVLPEDGRDHALRRVEQYAPL